MVKCTDYDGKHIWEITLREMGNAWDLYLTVDQNWNIYVSDRYDDKLYIVSSDGTCNRQLMQKSDGLSSPNGIYYNIRKQQLRIITNPSTTALLFDVK